MQIESIKISNLLSFPYKENINLEDGINFKTNQSGGVNVFIGPNGSGKTNLIKIITELINIGLIDDYSFQLDNNNLQNSIYKNQQYLNNIKAHFSSLDKQSNAIIKINISNIDKQNMSFIQKKREIFNHIIDTYSKINYRIPYIEPEKIAKQNSINIKFDINTKNQTSINVDLFQTDIENFIVDYFKYQELFQIAIIIYNSLIKTDSDKALYPLKNTFGNLLSNRNFNNLIDENHNSKLREKYLIDKNSQGYYSTIGYSLCIKKIWNIINNHSEENINLQEENINLQEEGIELNNENIRSKLANSFFFNTLKDNIKKYLEFELDIIYKDGEIKLLFIDNTGQAHDIHNISSGEQSLLIIILTIYGYDLNGGLLIIDEPEIHFHPQMQRRLIKMLEKLNDNIGTQFIISTYSPIFINEKNISSVYRFSKFEGETKIKCADGKLDQDEASLIQILKFENASKIFFVDKIIMVEGEIDAYFFDFYLQYLHTFPEWKDKIQNYEIININGKGSYSKRNKFLDKFGIDSAFIGDWDNIVDYGLLNQNDLNYYYKKAKSYHPKNGDKTLENRHYTKLVSTMQYGYPDKYDAIIKSIEKLYDKNVFILKRGDIETYLGMKTKGLEETIEFCHKYFDLWLKNQDLRFHKVELESIIYKIFSKKNIYNQDLI